MRDLIYKIELAMFETALNPSDPLGDYTAKRKALYDLETDPVLLKEPELVKAVQQRKLDLEKEAKANGVKTEMSEEWNAEYDDEAGMADNNLETMKRAVQGLDDLISAGDNLPEWCQEKIAVSKSMLVAVWDYMQSEKGRQ
jgi:hypothetical protein